MAQTKSKSCNKSDSFRIILCNICVFKRKEKSIKKNWGNQGVVKQQIWSSLSFDNQKHCLKMQKQPSISVFRKRCSENMQQIYRRLPMPKCDFNKVALKLYIEITLRHECSPANLLHIFRTPFPKNISEGLPLKMACWSSD